MAKKVTVSLQVAYTFKGEVLKDYLEWLDDHRDSKKMRQWFVIDRAVGHDQLFELQSSKKLDPAMKVVITEVEVA
jgi:hypothetical protein